MSTASSPTSSSRGAPLAIDALIAETARARGADTALSVIARGGQLLEELTWQELDARAAKLAQKLARGGAEPGDVVAVALPAGAGHAVATLALWRLGAIVMPIDHQLSNSRRRRLGRRYPKGLFIEDRFSLRSYNEPGTPSRQLQEASADGLPRSVSLSGGTTGEPKLVLRNRPWAYPAGRVLGERERVRGLDYGQTQLVGLPLYHAGFGALYHGLALGHRMVIPGDRSPVTFLELLESEGVEVLRTVPAQMSAALAVPDVGAYNLGALRVMVHTGASCPEAVKRRWLELAGPERIWEEYGSVERLGVIDIGGAEWLAHPGSIGRAQTCEARILDEDGNEVDVRERGQLFIASETASQPVYVDRGPKLVECGGYFTLGDIATRDEDGYITLCGRRDGMINVGGMKVYPREVERVIERHPDVLDAMVFGVAQADFGEVVAARIVVGGDLPREAVREIRRACQAQLPAFMVPQRIEVVEDLGRTEAGKTSLARSAAP